MDTSRLIKMEEIFGHSYGRVIPANKRKLSQIKVPSKQMNLDLKTTSGEIEQMYKEVKKQKKLQRMQQRLEPPFPKSVRAASFYKPSAQMMGRGRDQRQASVTVPKDTTHNDLVKYSERLHTPQQMLLSVPSNNKSNQHSLVSTFGKLPVAKPQL